MALAPGDQGKVLNLDRLAFTAAPDSTDQASDGSDLGERRGGGKALRATLGFVPLTDCAPLIVALEKGFFRAAGINVTLSREPSWANIRDKVAVGELDGAQMLAPMALAAGLGIAGPAHDLIAPMSLGLNGNAVTVVTWLADEIRRNMAQTGDLSALGAARALRRVIDVRREQGEAPLTFATVYPFSCHNYQLRYWMAAGGIDPDADLRLVVVPPTQMVERLALGEIVGCCVGEPWNTVAEAQGVGRVVATGYDIWNNAPEKVLAVSAAWAQRNPAALLAVMQGLLRAARWLGEPENNGEAIELLTAEHYLGEAPNIIAASLGANAPNDRRHSVFFAYTATFPWVSHAAWLLGQMVRWGQITTPLDILATARAVYRPDLYRQAAAALGVACPVVDMKAEGAHATEWRLDDGAGGILLPPDRFCDHSRFEATDAVNAMRLEPIHQRRVALPDLASFNP